MRRLLLCLAAFTVLTAGCATPDPVPPPRWTPQPLPANVRPPAAVTTAPPPSNVTSDPGTRYLPLDPLGRLTVETEPAPPPGYVPAAQPSEVPVADEAPPADDLGYPPTGRLPPPRILR